MDTPRVEVERGMGDDFYVRYYVGHKGKFGHEFLEFEFHPDGKVRGSVCGWMLRESPAGL